MKKILFIFMLLGMTQGIIAQPQARRQQTQQKTLQSNANNMTTRAQISFPTAAPMDEDVVWRRDIYRELDLNEDANAGLYYPVEPIGNQMNLFTSIFRLMKAGNNGASNINEIPKHIAIMTVHTINLRSVSTASSILPVPKC